MFVVAHLLGGIKALYPHQEYRKSNVKELDYFPEQTEPGTTTPLYTAGNIE